MTAISVEISDDHIAKLIIDVPDEKLNTFSLPILEELEQHLDRLASDSSIRALALISGKKDSFIAGANLHSFEAAFNNPSIAEPIIRTGHRVFQKLEDLPFPTIALIHGSCFGGGLECALSCTYRVVSDHPKTLLSLPEVTLGIFPGWGGSQRLPRLVGLAEGLNMILTGKAIPGLKAWKMHLADALVPWEFLTEKSDAFIRLILTKEGKAQVEKRRQRKSFPNRLLENNPLGRALVYYQAKKAVLEKTKGHYPAPLIVLKLIAQTYPLPLKEGLKQEAETFIANIPEGFRLAPHLIALFFTQEAAKKEFGNKEFPPLNVESAAVLGAGTMGAGIAWLLADHQIFTRLKDISWDLVGKGIATTKALFDKGLKAKKIAKCDYSKRLQLVSGTIDYSGFQHAQLVIEAATENLELKRKIFQEVEAVVSPTALIASNTSSLTIAEMAQGMKHPERFVALHFFNPVHKMPLVEVVAGPQSSPEAVASAVDACRKLGKFPMVVGDCHGFLVNRILMPGANEAFYMLEEGYPMETIEKAFLDFGMPMEPFALTDEIGIDVTYKVAKVFEKAYGERMRPAKLMQLMTEQGLFGHKNGKGFYLYEGKKQTVNPAIKQLLKAVGRLQPHPAQEDILPRFLYGMINEAARCLEEKVISRADFLDLSLIMGIGFPPYRGGLLRQADEIGISTVVSTLTLLEQQVGSRFKPCALLEKMAQEKRLFYSTA